MYKLHTYIQTYAHTYELYLVCMYVCMYLVCMNVCLHACMYVYVYVSSKMLRIKIIVSRVHINPVYHVYQPYTCICTHVYTGEYIRKCVCLQSMYIYIPTYVCTYRMCLQYVLCVYFLGCMFLFKVYNQSTCISNMRCEGMYGCI